MKLQAYYNEFDPFAALWLRQLISDGLIAPGVVDTRSIEDVNPDELREFGQCHFFAGIGIWSYALRQTGIPDDCPIWTGSAPCQAFSEAGKRGGFADERDLWPALHHLVRCRKPVAIFGEQVASAIPYGWLDRVHSDMAGEGYEVGASVFGAHSVGAPHGRKRLYWMARFGTSAMVNADNRLSANVRQVCREGDSINATEGNRGWTPYEVVACDDGYRRRTQPGVFPLAYGNPGTMDKMRGYGNAVVAKAAAAFIEAAKPLIFRD